MSIPVHPDSLREWAKIPVDDVGYVSSRELLDLSDNALRALIDTMEAARYGGWRNKDGLWRSTLGLDTTTDRRVLDWGCGIGMEALQYARAGNDVWLADILIDNVLLAKRVLKLYGYDPAGCTTEPGYIPPEVEVIHCAGVLHHIPDPDPIVTRFQQLLRPFGKLRLMLYSDVGWSIATHGAPLDYTDELTPERQAFIRYFDDVGTWAQWYNEARLQAWFGDRFTLDHVTYITHDRRYLTAQLTRRWPH